MSDEDRKRNAWSVANCPRIDCNDGESPRYYFGEQEFADCAAWEAGMGEAVRATLRGEGARAMSGQSATHVQRVDGRRLKKLTLYLPAAMAKRLAIHCAEHGESMSNVTSDAVGAHLGAWSIPQPRPLSDAIYVVACRTTGFVKLGCAFDVERRIAELQRDYGKALTLLGTRPGDSELEASLHARYAHANAGHIGREWFTSEVVADLGLAHAYAVFLAASRASA